jgi:hypothetical protein
MLYRREVKGTVWNQLGDNGECVQYIPDPTATRNAALGEAVREALGVNPLTGMPWQSLSLHEHAADLREAGIDYAARLLDAIAAALDKEGEDD